MGDKKCGKEGGEWHSKNTRAEGGMRVALTDGAEWNPKWLPGVKHSASCKTASLTRNMDCKDPHEPGTCEKMAT